MALKTVGMPHPHLRKTLCNLGHIINNWCKWYMQRWTCKISGAWCWSMPVLFWSSMIVVIHVFCIKSMCPSNDIMKITKYSAVNQYARNNSCNNQLRTIQSLWNSHSFPWRLYTLCIVVLYQSTLPNISVQHCQVHCTICTFSLVIGRPTVRYCTHASHWPIYCTLLYKVVFTMYVHCTPCSRLLGSTYICFMPLAHISRRIPHTFCGTSSCHANRMQHFMECRNVLILVKYNHWNSASTDIKRKLIWWKFPFRQYQLIYENQNVVWWTTLLH